MTRRLKNLNVDFISLVRKPANDKSIILKDNKEARAFNISKTNDEWQRAYGIVYSPEVEDLQGDITSSSVIKDASDRFMQGGLQGNIDTNHSFQTQTSTFVAESWLVKENDPQFPNDTGAWAVGIQVNDDKTWQQLKSGELTGISLAGSATVEPQKSEEFQPPSWFVRLFTKATQPNEGTEEMTKEEIKGFVTKIIDERLKKGVETENIPVETEVVPSTDDKINDDMSIAAMDDFIKKHINQQLSEHLKKGTQETGAPDVNNYEESYL
ncbi:MAG: XkdF-like putative serine protease domain-containing protein [Candidatus Parabeggiatoa sp.]|nr:XkdF-like putative serine protease domain-containing protein [Candidatus Parabeggiatoa sp.]